MTKLHDYVSDAFADYDAVIEGTKPLLIVSSGKSAYACEALGNLAKRDFLQVTCATARFVCEDGEVHTHVFIAPAGTTTGQDAITAIWRNIERVGYDGWDPRRSRQALQLELGLMLGYEPQAIVDFMRSDIGRTCPCDCCGGPETAEEPALVVDPNPGRFIENSYRF
jgi:hypothetical protein